MKGLLLKYKKLPFVLSLQYIYLVKNFLLFSNIRDKKSSEFKSDVIYKIHLVRTATIILANSDCRVGKKLPCINGIPHQIRAQV